MRLSLSRSPLVQQQAPQLVSPPPDAFGLVYGCEEEGCGKLALQACVRCGLRFCTDHIRAWERDLPARGLKLPSPDWYCYQCRTTI